MLSVAKESGFSPNREPARAGLELLDDPAWFLDRLDAERGVAIFTHATRKALSDAVFLDPSWDRADAPRRAVSFAALKNFQGVKRPAAMLWHSAFCCSTLIASCLDAPGLCLAMKEPAALVDLNAAWRRRREDVDDSLVAAVFALLGRGFTPGERVLIKPSNGANGLVAPGAAAGAPTLLLYSSCRDFILSVAGGGPARGGAEERRQFVRDLMAERVMVGCPGVRWRPEDLFAASDLQTAALLWHAQMAEFRAVARARGPRQVRSLDCAVFLADPARALNALDDFFTLGLGPARIANAASGPKFSRYAKQPSHAFSPEQRHAGQRAIEVELGANLNNLVTWSYRVCPETPHGDPVGSPLMPSNA